MKARDTTIAVLYGMFLLLASPFLHSWSSAVIDTLGIDRHLPSEVTPFLVIGMASLLFTVLALMPLVVLKGRSGLKRPAIVFFSLSFAFDLLLLWLGFMSTK
ncbi:hypothetical protein GQS_02985 [Thermococcus sp. 4557]|uniref:hypothetical protein n=1 Tax=Thermococcus sp. (strain CGMCC 1.5172 / 4557) TaxID=1042877 RepID=UPI000219EF34|nr:hypothetical protein [Thermococcus sp. 4557]AEK72498.1 hypothetical protein GQS_02985 [Thermococcus sp. 4557]